MINSLKVSALRNGEYLQFMADVLSIVKQNDPAKLNVQQQYDDLLALSQDIKGLFKVPTGSIISTELEELDLRRDNAITGITAAINAYTYSPDPTIKSHAKRLENHLSVFGSVARDNYQSETASLEKIIADWDSQPELTAALTALGLTAWRTEMEDANNEFNKRHLARGKETGTASDDSISTIRLETNDAYYALRDHLNAWFTINKGADPFGITVSSINGSMETYNALLERRVNNIPEAVAAPAA